jgi:hypothetical protein
VGFSKRLGSFDRFEPTYHADAKRFSLEWRHELGGGSTLRALTTTVDQRDETVAVEVRAPVALVWAKDGGGGVFENNNPPTHTHTRDKINIKHTYYCSY